MSQGVILYSRQEDCLHLLEKNKDKGIYKLKRDGVIAKRSRVKENDSNDSDFPLKLMEKTTNSMDIG